MKPIVVLDQGRILEEGTHHALLAAKGFYSRLWEQQALRIPKVKTPGLRANAHKPGAVKTDYLFNYCRTVSERTLRF